MVHINFLKGGGGGGGDQGSQQQKAEQQRQQMQDMKNSILSQVLTQEARARCNYFKSVLISLGLNWTILSIHEQFWTNFGV